MAIDHDLMQVKPFDDIKTQCAKLIINLSRICDAKGRHMNQLRETLAEKLWDAHCEAAAHPLYWDMMIIEDVVIRIPWKISKEELQVIEDEVEDFDRFMSLMTDKAGEILPLITASLKVWDFYHIVFGTEEYAVITLPCSESYSRKVCSLLHIEYGNEIRNKQIRVIKESIGPRFADMECCHQAQKYLDKKDGKEVSDEDPCYD